MVKIFLSKGEDMKGRARKVARRIVRKHLARIAKKVMRRRRFSKMVRKAKRTKSINNAFPKRGGIMVN